MRRSGLVTPVGSLQLFATERGLSGVFFEQHHPAPTLRAEEGDSALLSLARVQLTEYFAGARKVFSVPLDPVGTVFQKLVWTGLTKIPYGDHQSYAWLARELQKPKAVRAVGSANRKNPLSIIVPCHRVLGADGSLTGYAGGLERKQWLLAHEQRYV